MEAYRERVVVEKQELDGKIEKLADFFKTTIYYNLDIAEKGRMQRQVVLMRGYSNVLGERIAAFGGKI